MAIPTGLFLQRLLGFPDNTDTPIGEPLQCINQQYLHTACGGTNASPGINYTYNSPPGTEFIFWDLICEKFDPEYPNAWMGTSPDIRDSHHIQNTPGTDLNYGGHLVMWYVMNINFFVAGIAPNGMWIPQLPGMPLFIRTTDVEAAAIPAGSSMDRPNGWCGPCPMVDPNYPLAAHRYRIYLVGHFLVLEDDNPHGIKGHQFILINGQQDFCMDPVDLTPGWLIRNCEGAEYIVNFTTEPVIGEMYVLSAPGSSTVLDMACWTVIEHQENAAVISMTDVVIGTLITDCTSCLQYEFIDCVTGNSVYIYNPSSIDLTGLTPGSIYDVNTINCIFGTPPGKGLKLFAPDTLFCISYIGPVQLEDPLEASCEFTDITGAPYTLIGTACIDCSTCYLFHPCDLPAGDLSGDINTTLTNSLLPIPNTGVVVQLNDNEDCYIFMGETACDINNMLDSSITWDSNCDDCIICKKHYKLISCDGTQELLITWTGDNPLSLSTTYTFDFDNEGNCWNATLMPPVCTPETIILDQSNIEDSFETCTLCRELCSVLIICDSQIPPFTTDIDLTPYIGQFILASFELGGITYTDVCLQVTEDYCRFNLDSISIQMSSFIFNDCTCVRDVREFVPFDSRIVKPNIEVPPCCSETDDLNCNLVDPCDDC